MAILLLICKESGSVLRFQTEFTKHERQGKKYYHSGKLRQVSSSK